MRMPAPPRYDGTASAESTSRVRAAYDAIAGEYDAAIGDELDA
jgi:hypothetical protein